MTREDTSVAVADGPAQQEPGADHGDARRARARRRVAWELAVLLAVLGLGVATRWIDATTPRMLPAIQALGSSLGPLSVVVLLAALWSRLRGIAVAAAVLAVVQLTLFVPWWIAGPHAVAPTSPSLTVMASNMQYGEGDPDAVVAAVRDRGVDVLALSETTPEARDALERAGLTAVLPHVVDHARVGAAGGMIFSRYALTTDVAPSVPTATFATPAARVDAPGGAVVVVAAHPVPPWPGDTARWHSELAALASWAAQVDADVPLVLAGDMNATLAHPVLRRFTAAGLHDAHREIGRGPVATWPHSRRWGVPIIPLLQLDHVLSRGFGIAGAGTVIIPGSDHDAVWAQLAPQRR